MAKKSKRKRETTVERLLCQRAAARNRHQTGNWMSGADLTTGICRATEQPHPLKRIGYGVERSIQRGGKKGGGS